MMTLLVTASVSTTRGQIPVEHTYIAVHDPSHDLRTISSVAFASNDALVVRMCNRQANCQLIKLAIDADGIREVVKSPVEQSDRPSFSSRLQRTPQGDLILDKKWLDGSNFRVKGMLPEFEPLVSSDGSLFSSREGSAWCIERVGNLPMCAVRAETRPLALGANVIVVQKGEDILLFDLHMKQTGLLHVGKGCLVAAKVLYAAGVLVNGCNQTSIVTTSGIVKRTFKRLPLGYDDVIADDEGRRLLFITHQRQVPVAQKVREASVAIATLGVGVVDEEANSVLFRVIDANTGAEAFRRVVQNDPSQDVAIGDLSPNGQTLAIASHGIVHIVDLSNGL
jgi:hypothetical protein